MGKHSGGAVRGPGVGRIVLLIVGIVATFVAWGALVYYAIQFGPDATAGRPSAWVLLVVATLGAIGCLFLTLILGGKLVELLRGEPRSAPVASRHSKR